jgi:cysteine desulfurase
MIYLDNAASTRILPEVRAAMEPFLGEEFGNPSSPHASGRRARRAVEDARETVASCLGADPREIVFTSGATEANALAIAGAAGALRRKGDRVVTTAIEHPSVLEACARLEARGLRAVRVMPDARGVVPAADVAAAWTPETVLVSVMLVNNEVGAVQPVAEIRRRLPGALLHADAAQAVGKIPVAVTGVDLLTLSAHKMHGPKGAGALWVRRGVPLESQQGGGGQEFERRAGTENVAGIVGLAAAMKIACRDLEANAARMASLRRRLLEGFRRAGGVHVHGDPDGGAPHLLSVSFEGVESQALVLALDAAGVGVSAGSACAAMSPEPSHVLRAMGLPPDRAREAVRFGLSALTTAEEVGAAAEIVGRSVARLRKTAAARR